MSENKRWYIYVLKDPRTDEVRYVGKTVDPVRRYNNHLSRLKNIEANTYRARWVMRLQELGHVPVMQIIETGTDDNAANAEKFWIIEYRKNGACLTNLTDGGDGTPGLSRNAETRKRMSEAQRLRPPPAPDVRLKISQTLKGRKIGPFSEEHKRNMSKAKMGHVVSDEQKKKHVEVMRAKRMAVNPLICIETGDKYSSIVELSKILKCSKSDLGLAIKNGEAFRGMHYKFKNGKPGF